jgi:hypothetical protein
MKRKKRKNTDNSQIKKNIVKLLGSKEFNNYYDSLNSDNFIKRKIDERKEEFRRDHNTGSYIKNKPYPKDYDKYEVKVLFVDEITDNMRLIYTIISTKDIKYYKLIEVLTHKQYDIKFGYHTS